MEIRAAFPLHLHYHPKSRRPAPLRLGVVLIPMAMFAGVRSMGEAPIGRSTVAAATATASGSFDTAESGRVEIAMTTQHEPGVAKNDCEIFALLGREILGWGKVETDISQFAIFYRPQGDGFVEQCPWADLGVERLKATKPDPDNMRFFTAPKYSADGQTATVSFVTKLVGRNPDGSARPPFISQEELSLKKIDGHWSLVSRKLGAIT
ncbi:MAG TPA: hypothetical protein VJX73_10645 [Terracidiphilus sp.]|nr:hypothetical protein [Terracidiphilus sp.]